MPGRVRRRLSSIRRPNPTFTGLAFRLPQWCGCWVGAWTRSQRDDDSCPFAAQFSGIRVIAMGFPRSLYEAAMRMHEDMLRLPPTSNADVDFLVQMIPRHEGANDSPQCRTPSSSVSNVTLSNTRRPESIPATRQGRRWWQRRSCAVARCARGRI